MSGCEQKVTQGCTAKLGSVICCNSHCHAHACFWLLAFQLCTRFELTEGDSHMGRTRQGCPAGHVPRRRRRPAQVLHSLCGELLRLELW